MGNKIYVVPWLESSCTCTVVYDKLYGYYSNLIVLTDTDVE